MKHDEEIYYIAIILWNNMHITTTMRKNKRELMQDLANLALKYRAFMIYKHRVTRITHYCKDAIIKADYDADKIEEELDERGDL